MKNKEVKLNLGCGVKMLPNFINVDVYDIEDLKKKQGVFWEAEVKGLYLNADIRELPFPDEYADYILASEVLEHIPLKDINKTLREWYRVLKTGGRMVIKCPNFNALAEQWLTTEFNPESYGDMAQGIYGNQLTEKEYHLSPITPQMLNYYIAGMGVKEGKIGVYPKGHTVVGYPGIKEDKTRVYRFGDVHCDFIK